MAALASLRVAILDGDAETAINWLRLVAREPASYDLGEVVHYGILSAQERARSEPDLAQALILLAVKRDQAALEMLLADEALLAAVPNALGVALRNGEGDPLACCKPTASRSFWWRWRGRSTRAAPICSRRRRLSRSGRSTPSGDDRNGGVVQRRAHRQRD